LNDQSKSVKGKNSDRKRTATAQLSFGTIAS
jgi:hypothetical protein